MTRRQYRRALRLLLPRDFLDRYGREMEQMHAEARAEATGALERMRIEGRAVGDLLVTALMLRVRPGQLPDPARVLEGRRAVRSLTKRGGTGMWGSDWSRDIRTAARGFWRRPGFATVAILTLALGIGASSAVFTVVDATVLRALPYPEPDELLALHTEFDRTTGTVFGFSDAEFIDYAEEQTSFEVIGAYALSQPIWRPVGGEPVRVQSVSVYPGLAETLELEARLGRIPSEAETVAGTAGLLMVSYHTWQQNFGGDPALIGRTVRLNETDREIVAVLAPDVRLPDGDPDFWVVSRPDRGEITDRSGHYLTVVGRLAEGATIGTARQEIGRVHRSWADRFAGDHTPGAGGHTLEVRTLEAAAVGSTRQVAWILVAGSGMLLLLACVNVAGLLIARGEGRLGELGIRAALGAGRGRLGRQLLAESLLLALVGGGVGFLLASVGTELLVSMEPGILPGLDRATPGARTLFFTVGVALLTGLGFGLAPVLRIPVDGTATLIRQRAGRSGDRGPIPILSGLIVGQIALATVVVIAAGLLERSRSALTSTDPGFETEGVMAFDLSLPFGEYFGEPERTQLFWDRLTEMLEGSSGVETAAIVRNLPLRDDNRHEMIVRDGDPMDRHSARQIVLQAVTPGYFSVMGIPVLSGRAIEPGDRADGQFVAVVSRATERAYFPEGAVGQRFRATFGGPDTPTYTIVGVVDDIRHDLESAVAPTLYLAYAQVPARTASWTLWGTVVASVDRVDEASFGTLARRIVDELEPTIPVEQVTTLTRVFGGATARMRFLSVLLGVFAITALVVAAVGVYGMSAFSVARRRAEFGVRLALGAIPSRLLASVLGSGLRMALVGAVIGIAGALALGPVLAGALYEVSPRDMVAMIGGPLALLAVALLATAIPAWRAATIPPVQSLRGEG